jgi:hypothetical protein
LREWLLTKRTPWEYCESCKRDVGEEVYELKKPISSDRDLWSYLCEGCAAKKLGGKFLEQKERATLRSEMKREQGKALQQHKRNRQLAGV